jgi:hypothetical protein
MKSDMPPTPDNGGGNGVASSDTNTVEGECAAEVEASVVVVPSSSLISLLYHHRRLVRPPLQSSHSV